jgi:hypothetical protein
MRSERKRQNTVNEIRRYQPRVVEVGATSGKLERGPDVREITSLQPTRANSTYNPAASILQAPRGDQSNEFESLSTVSQGDDPQLHRQSTVDVLRQSDQLGSAALQFDLMVPVYTPTQYTRSGVQ